MPNVEKLASDVESLQRQINILANMIKALEKRMAQIEGHAHTITTATEREGVSRVTYTDKPAYPTPEDA